MSPSNIAGGHKANINNPNTSEESKQHSRDVLDSMQSSGELEHSGSGEKNENNVIGGHKANLNNPNTSDEAKEHSRQILQEKEAI